MFALALVALIPTAFAALQVAQPTVPVRSSSPVTITWTSDNGDPTFSIELINLSFNHAYAIANNVDPNEKSRTISFPEVPAGDGYSIQFVNIADINDVYTTTGNFAIQDAISTTSTASSSTSGTTAIVTPTISRTSAPTTGFGTTKAAVAGGITSSSQTSASVSASSNSASNTAGTLGAPNVMGVVAGLLAWLAL